MSDADLTPRGGEVLPITRANDQRLVEARRERDRVRKREARKRQRPNSANVNACASAMSASDIRPNSVPVRRTGIKSAPEGKIDRSWPSMGRAAGPTI